MTMHNSLNHSHDFRVFLGAKRKNMFSLVFSLFLSRSRKLLFSTYVFVVVPL